MKYYYDLLVNINEELYEFYEWSKFDGIERIKRIPIFKISSKDFKKIIDYKIKIDIDTLGMIKGKVLGYNRDVVMSNGILFTDMYESVVVEFNDEGEEIGISKLLMNDNLNVMEIVFAIPSSKVVISKIIKRDKNRLRQDEIVKRFLKIEYDTLKERNNYQKLRFLGYERFGKDIEDKKVYEMLINDLKVITSKHYELYELVKLSYKKVPIGT